MFNGETSSFNTIVARENSLASGYLTDKISTVALKAKIKVNAIANIAL